MNCNSKSKSHSDWRSVSKSWCQAPSGAHDQVFITLWQLRSCFCGAPSLTRGWVCLLYMLLAFASAVFLGSESVGARDHILESQIWASPFRRLLRLAGSRVELHLAVGRQTRRRYSQSRPWCRRGRRNSLHSFKSLRTNAELVVRQSPASKDVNTEAVEAMALEAVIRQPMKTQQTEKI
jgi:hypothetical protein